MFSTRGNLERNSSRQAVPDMKKNVSPAVPRQEECPQYLHGSNPVQFRLTQKFLHHHVQTAASEPTPNLAPENCTTSHAPWVFIWPFAMEVTETPILSISMEGLPFL